LLPGLRTSRGTCPIGLPARCATGSEKAGLMTAPNFELIRAALLRRPLPGLSAQLLMAPAHRREWLREMPKPDGAKEGSVCVLLYPGEYGLTLPLTRRTDDLAHHRGQISLPGGAREPGESLGQTALREAQEELGVDLAGAGLLGQLSPVYVQVSDYYVTPFVVAFPGRPVFRPDPREVVYILEVPLAAVLDPTARREEVWELQGGPTRVPYFSLADHKVWGATAMVLSELAVLVNSGRPPEGVLP